MGINIPSNDNIKTILPVKPNSPTPMGMFSYANEVLDMWKSRLDRINLSETKKMRFNKQIIECKKLKVMAFNAMTDEGFKHDEICCQ